MIFIVNIKRSGCVVSQCRETMEKNKDGLISCQTSYYDVPSGRNKYADVENSCILSLMDYQG